MDRDYWRTYNGRQASQIASAVQYLLDGGVLEKDEEDTARRIQARLRGSISGSEDTTMVPFTKKEDELLSQVEATLWK